MAIIRGTIGVKLWTKSKIDILITKLNPTYKLNKVQTENNRASNLSRFQLNQEIKPYIKVIAILAKDILSKLLQNCRTNL